MKLELRHLAPYLPYGLKCITSRHQIKYGERTELLVNGISIDNDQEVNIEFLYNDDLEFSNSMRQVFPILRPLSDLTKEIEHKEERFIPIKRMGRTEQDAFQIQGGPIYALAYGVVEQLFEWHFDVFELIPKGLAIDINTIKS